MGSQMAPNYANIFMDKIEQVMLNDFYKKYGLNPLIWLRYIDDILCMDSWTEIISIIHRICSNIQH